MTSLVTVVTSFAVGVTTALILKNCLGRIFVLGSRGKLEVLSGTKLAIIVRSDVKMGKGKMCSQCAHAALSCYMNALKKNPNLVKVWETEGEPKVFFKSDGEGEAALYNLVSEAHKHNLIVAAIRDAGRTQIARNTLTVVGIGPGDAASIDKIVSHLKPL